MLNVFNLSDLDQKKVAELCLRNADGNNNIRSTVEDIIEEVKLKGDMALRAFAEKFDGIKLQQLHIDVRHRLSTRLAATFSYLYEPFRVYDFAFDPSVVNGIAQPSSLVMGYVYRPYTANSFVFGLKYFW